MCTSFIFAVAINLGKSPFHNHRYSMIWTFLLLIFFYLPSFNSYLRIYIRNWFIDRNSGYYSFRRDMFDYTSAREASIEIQVSTFSVDMISIHCISILSTRPFLTFFCTYLLLIAIFDYTSAREASIEIQVSTVSVAIYDIDSLHLNIINTTVSYLLFTYLLLIAIFDYTSAREASIEIQVSMISIHRISILSTQPFLTFFLLTFF